ncbi:MAG: 50S ribosomal protein L18 [archaeon]
MEKTMKAKKSLRTLKKRKKDHKTDYGKRIKLLKSEKPRIVFRRTNRYFIVQYVKSEEARDKVIFGISSKELLKHGWPEKNKSSLKSISAAYFTGLLFGKKIIQKNLDTPIVDFGMLRALHKTKVFGFLKGLVDSGIEIKTIQETFPDEKKIQGENLKEKISFDEIKSKIEGLK